MDNRQLFFIYLPLFGMLMGCSKEKPKILIIGDSISIGYTPYLETHFADRAVVKHNPGNAQHTGTGLQKIKEWTGDEEWDIVQFNWGLWDLCYRHPDSKVQGNRDKINGKLTNTVEEYSSNLDSIVTVLQQVTDAKLIFLTTTYVPEQEAGRFKQDAVRYNEAAKKIMKKHSILVHDIYEASEKIHHQFGKGSDDVHYTDKGYEELSKPVIDFLNQQMLN